MTRVWTYVTLDGAGEPTAAGIAYDLEICELNTRMSRNFIIQQLRDGRDVVLWDSKEHFEIAGSFLFPPIDVDERSLVQYLGSYRYLGPNLYHHYKYHMPIVLFLAGFNNASKKAYVCYIVEFPEEIAAQATLDTTQIMHFSRIEMPRTLRLGLEITIGGAWSDFDDITTVIWEART